MARRLRLALGLSLLGAAGGGVAGWLYIQNVYDFPIESRKLEARVRAAQEAGVPLTLGDLDHVAPVPDDQNAFVLMVEAEAAFSAILEAPRRVEELQAAARTNDFATLERLVPVFEGVLDGMEVASRRQHLRNTSIDWEYPPYTTFSGYSFYRRAADLWCARAQLRTSKGALRGAYEDIASAKRWAALTNQEPFILGSLVASSVHTIIARSSVRMLATQFEQNRPVRPMVLELTRTNTWPAWEHALRSEALFGIQTVRNMDRLGGLRVFERMPTMDVEQMPPRPTVPARKAELPTDVVSRGSMVRILEQWTAAFRTAENGTLDPQRFLAKIDEMAAIADKSRKRSYTMIRSEFTPMMGGLGWTIDRVRSHQKLVLVYGLVLAFRQENGRWPKSLDEAGVGMADPVNQEPFGYLIVEEGFKVWPVGPDESREAPPESSAARVGDIFEYPIKPLPKASQTRP